MDIAKQTPNEEIVNVLLTDCYQLMMIYAHWKNNRHNIRSVFDLYFRKSPFDLQFSVMGGIDECFHFIKNFKFTERHIEYLKGNFKDFDKGFFDYLSGLDLSKVNVYGVENASIVTPNTPLLTLEGPINEIQLIETTLLNLTNYPTLIASLAYKLRLLYPDKILIEDGSQYGQSPNGSLSGCKYSYIGTVNSTTSLIASSLYEIDLYNTHPEVEEEISNFNDLFGNKDLFSVNSIDLLDEASRILCNNNHLTTSPLFKSRLIQAIILPQSFTIRITDKLNIEDLNSNRNIADFIIISFLLQKLNYFNQTLFLDFEDAYLITENLRQNIKFSENLKYLISVKYSSKMLKSVKGDFDIIMLGPEFLTSETKTALGMVYKLMDFNNSPCIKFSEEKEKRTIPGFKKTLRFYEEQNNIICDYLMLKEEYESFRSNEVNTIMGFYPYDESKEGIKITFNRAELLTKLLFEKGNILYSERSANELRESVSKNVKVITNSIKIPLYVSQGIIDIIRKELEKNK